MTSVFNYFNIQFLIKCRLDETSDMLDKLIKLEMYLNN